MEIDTLDTYMFVTQLTLSQLASSQEWKSVWSPFLPIRTIMLLRSDKHTMKTETKRYDRYIRLEPLYCIMHICYEA